MFIRIIWDRNNISQAEAIGIEVPFTMPLSEVQMPPPGPAQ